ncbi:hypothetical protein BH23VER1_BH23VER1_34990 [soil metagenome]
MHRATRTLAVIIAAALYLPPLIAGEPVELFDGKSLAGWESVGTAEWRVEDGAIVGGQDGDPSKSGLLMTGRTFQDFELELEFMIDEHGKYNSGVYLRHVPGERSRRGYQVNIGRGAAGEPVGLYLEDWLDKGDAEDAIRKPGEWNHLRIRALGAHIQVWLNGQAIVNYTDPDPAPELLAPGVIAVQTYGAEGHAGWVKFRRIRLKTLPQE